MHLNISKRFFFLMVLLLVLFIFYISSKLNLVGYIIISFFFLFAIIIYLLVYYLYPNIAKSSEFPKKVPSVAVVTYAFNDFFPILKTVKHLLKLKYPKPFKVYVITDGTCDFLDKLKGVKKITISKKYFITNKNVKSIVMNKGMKYIHEENIFCVDGDTLPDLNSLMLMTGFLKGKVAAVNGIILPSNKSNLLEKLQVLEYNLNWGLYMRVLSAMNAISIPIGAMFLMKKKVFDELGGYDIYNITEDRELGYRILEKGYIIRCAEDAKGYTETPTNIKDWVRQRLRWSRGELATIYKHRNFILNPKYGLFGLFVLPYVFLLETIGIGLLFSQIIFSIRKVVVSIFYIVLESLKQGVFIMPKIQYIYFNSVIFLFILSTSLFLLYAINAFKIAKFKISKDYIFPFIIFSTIYIFCITVIYLVSMLLEFFNFKMPDFRRSTKKYDIGSEINAKT